MKWKNHQVVGYAVAYVVTGDILSSLISLPMSVLPDAIEGMPKLKFLKHRGWSHNILLWGALSHIAYLVFPSHRPLVMAAIIGLASHFLCDCLTMSGVPIWKNKVLKLRLFVTGSVAEYVIAYGTLAAAFCYRQFYLGQSQGPTMENAMEEVKQMFYVLTQPHFASWLISVLPYNLIACTALVVAVWMIVFRELFTFGTGIIIMAIVLFFVGQSMT
ncbi:MAG TPA: metal-dependent hydrolase [Syntrophales bacterium]|nr:metal-dependent hydrolase [Syntrophales bacterium]